MNSVRSWSSKGPQFSVQVYVFRGSFLNCLMQVLAGFWNFFGIRKNTDFLWFLYQVCCTPGVLQDISTRAVTRKQHKVVIQKNTLMHVFYSQITP